VLCIPFIDDQSLPKWISKFLYAHEQRYYFRKIQRLFAIPIAVIIISILCVFNWASIYKNTEINKAEKWLNDHARISSITDFFSSKLHVVSSYGLFRVMTKTRPEIILYGSVDKQNWKRYVFKYKPVELDAAPAWIIPHMPRLDWQMWFEALRYERSKQVSSWFVSFLKALSQNKKPVIDFLDHNPFPNEAPKYFKIELYHYTFTTHEERDGSGNIWRQELLPKYTGTVAAADIK
jgi:glycosyltransferase involved in cell wall biosynthesis